MELAPYAGLLDDDSGLLRVSLMGRTAHDDRSAIPDAREHAEPGRSVAVPAVVVLAKARTPLRPAHKSCGAAAKRGTTSHGLTPRPWKASWIPCGRRSG